MSILFQYQYVEEHIKLNGEVAREIFRFTNGIPSMIIGLFVETQKKMILNKINKFTVDLFEDVYKSCFVNMMAYIEDKPIELSETIKNESISNLNLCPIKMPNLFQKMRYGSNMEPDSQIKELMKYIKVEFVNV